MSVYTINEKFRAVEPPPSQRDPHGAGPDRGGPAAGQGSPSHRQVRLAEMFGLGLDETYEVTLYDGLALDVRPGDVVFITGPSGSGKSVLLAGLVRAIRRRGPARSRIVDLADVVPAADRPVIDLLDAPLEAALRCLSTAGLADAFALLRRAPQLSDGQRYRLRLALALERLLAEPGATDCSSIGVTHSGVTDCEQSVAPACADAEADRDDRPFYGDGSHGPLPRPARTSPHRILVADEFCSTLDRLCARALAYRLRRLLDRSQGDPDGPALTVLAASAHDDLVEDLAPDVLVVKGAGEAVEVRYADPSRGTKNDRSLTVAASQDDGASRGGPPGPPRQPDQGADAGGEEDR